MTNRAGVWIDHRIAYVLRPGDGDCKVETVESGVEHSRRSTGGKGKSRPYMHENAASSASHFDASRKNALNKFYLRVNEHLREVEDLLILGPGEAKSELRSVILRGEQLKDCNVSMEPAPQITEAQLKKTVRRHFGRVPKRHWPDAPGQRPH